MARQPCVVDFRRSRLSWSRRGPSPLQHIKPATCSSGKRAGDGRGDRIRTCDPLLPKQMRYQAAPLPAFASYDGQARRLANRSPGLLRSEGWWARKDSNLQPSRYERPALPLSYRPSPDPMQIPAPGSAKAARRGKGRLKAVERPSSPPATRASPRNEAKPGAPPPRRRRVRTRSRLEQAPPEPRSAAGRVIATRQWSPVAVDRRGGFARRAPARPMTAATQADRATGRRAPARPPRSPLPGGSGARAPLRAPRPHRLASRPAEQLARDRPGGRQRHRRRMDLRREIQVVDRSEQQPCLRDDLGRALAIAVIGRAEVLAVDDLGKADDRVERRLDLVDQFPKRIRIGAGSPGERVPLCFSGRTSRSAIPR